MHAVASAATSPSSSTTTTASTTGSHRLPIDLGDTMYSVDDACRTCPDRLRALLRALDLQHPGLAAVQAAAAGDDLPAAMTALLAYYNTAPTAAWLRRSEAIPRGDATDPALEPLLSGTFTFYRHADTVPHRAGGGLNWLHRGPHDDQEWAWALNRHAFMDRLYRTYCTTGNPLYARTLDWLIRDWVLANPYDGQRGTSAPWRGLEASFRPKFWAPAFFGLLADPAFSPATRLLMLSSLPDHADYLHRHPGSNNWLTMEKSALALIAVAWPEFAASATWLQNADDVLTVELTAQNYPDGVQKELAAHYHWVSLLNFEHFATTLRNAGRPVSAAYARILEDMWHYLAYSLQPDGYNTLNNDSDREDFRQRLLDAAATYGRDDWRYIATGGTAGTLPPGLPSAAFPWAGQLVSRSGWDSDALWSFFDAGAWGIGHQHNDKLHLSVSALGRELLVDSGRFAYRGEIAIIYRERYAFHTRGHNTLLVDGLGQRADVLEYDRPHDGFSLQPGFDFGRGSFTAGYSANPRTAAGGGSAEQRDIAATHCRAVVYLHGIGWLVADQVNGDRPHAITALWHFHPSCTVEVDGTDNSVASVDPDLGNLRITPVGSPAWQAQVVKGQLEPHPQGWYSPIYNEYEPAPCATYTATVPAGQVVGWLLIPGRGTVPPCRFDVLPSPPGSLRVRLTPPGESLPVEVALRLSGDAPVALSGGYLLDGECAVQLPGQAPRAACGRVIAPGDPATR